MRTMHILSLSALGFILVAAPLSAAEPSMKDHAHHSASAEPNAKAASSPASAAYLEANQKMHAAMTQNLTGNADVDFVAGMIPHHQGAIDMAKIVLTYGKDPEVRKLAEAIIKAQESEITWMQAWLEKNQSLGTK